MNEEKYRFWDLLIKLFSVIVTLGVVFGGIFQFSKEQQNNIELEYIKLKQNDSLRTQQRIHEKKVEIYSEIGSVVGSILARTNVDSTFENRVNNFNRLYYGKAIIVENPNINRLMGDFRRSVEDFRTGFISAIQLKSIGIELVEALRKDISSTIIEK